MRASNEKMIEFIRDFSQSRYAIADNAMAMMKVMGKDWFNAEQLQMICGELIAQYRHRQRQYRASRRRLQRAG